MENFLLAFSVVFPLFVYMFIGGMVRKLNWFSEANFKALNKLIFQLFIPLTLFLDIYKADIGDAFEPKIFVFVFVMVILFWILSWFFYSRIMEDPADQATMIQGTFRSNYVLFGTTIGAAICDDPGITLIAGLAAMTVPLFNILSVLTFEFKRGGAVSARQMILSIFKNPLVDAAVLALAAHMLPIQIPELILNPLSKLGAAASPLALVTLGGMLSFGSMRSHIQELTIVTLGRLVIVPCIALSMAVLLGINGDPLVAILAIFASPTAVASNPMAYALGGNGPLAGEIVAVTSTFSIVTIFLIVYVLSMFSLI